ncbi:MAG TPA: phosphotransferase [Pseudonocardiaceae bacterium]|nr:phosphotransferase [Pseudonocardiaceae bacterium]
MTDPVAAAVEVAAAHGVRCTEPVVLRDGSNVLVHLAPAPVVARVAGLTARVRPAVAAHLARDVALAGWLAGRGVPVVAPSGELPAGPHLRAGRVLTFWTYVSHDPGHVWRPAEFGPLLAELHAVMADYPGELPTDSLLSDVPLAVNYLRSVGDTVLPDALIEDAAKLTLTGRAVPLHGDAHPGNLLATADGPVWTDFEDTWRGPVEWDLACLAATGRLDGPAAVAAYPHDPAALGPFPAARRLHGLVWSAVFHHHFPTPERRTDLLARLAEWRHTP